MSSGQQAAWRRAAGLALVGWVLLAAVRTGLRVAAEPRPWAAALAMFLQVLVATLPWVVLAPAVVMLSARSPLRGRAATVGLHVGLAIAVSVTDAVWGWLVWSALGSAVPVHPGVWYLFRLDQAAFLYLSLVALGIGLRHRQRLDATVVRTARAEAQLLRTRLHVLSLQLQPHFLFNTLNAVSELVHREPEAARTVLDSLAELLRRSLDGDVAQEHALRDELRLLEPYIRILRARFVGSLRIELDIAPATASALVPRLALQPLIENAIRHGTAMRAGPGRIAVRSRARGNRLVLEVEDDGAGLASHDRREGVGLGTTRARLAQLHGPAASLDLLPGERRGATARLQCPLRSAPPATDDPTPLPPGHPEAEHQPEEVASTRRLVGGMVAAWLLVALVGTLEDLVATHLAGSPAGILAVLGPRALEAGIWMSLTPAVWWVAARLAATGWRWPALVATHLVLGLGTVALHLALVSTLRAPAMGGLLLATVLVNHLCMYAAVAAAGHAWTVRRLGAERRAALARLDADVVASELEVLRWRLRPELLFGALERIRDLAASDPDAADDLTGRLGELLRLMLQVAAADLVPLSRELAFASAYVDVDMAVRSRGGALVTRVEPAASGVPVPARVLQPLLEAFDGRAVTITGRIRGSKLELLVEGRDTSLNAAPVLELRQRLAAVYGRNYGLIPHESGPVAGVTLQIPLPAAVPGRAVA